MAMYSAEEIDLARKALLFGIMIGTRCQQTVSELDPSELLPDGLWTEAAKEVKDGKTEDRYWELFTELTGIHRTSKGSVKTLVKFLKDQKLNKELILAIGSWKRVSHLGGFQEQAEKARKRILEIQSKLEVLNNGDSDGTATKPADQRGSNGAVGNNGTQKVRSENRRDLPAGQEAQNQRPAGQKGVRTGQQSPQRPQTAAVQRREHQKSPQ